MEGDPSKASSVPLTNEPPLVDRFQALVSVAELITSCREPKDLFRRLAAELERVVRFDFVAFVLHDPERGVVRGDLLDARSMALAPRPEAVLTESPAGLVVQTQPPLVVPDTSVETRFSEMTLIRQDGIESFCLLAAGEAHARELRPQRIAHHPRAGACAGSPRGGSGRCFPARMAILQLRTVLRR